MGKILKLVSLTMYKSAGGSWMGSAGSGTLLLLVNVRLSHILPLQLIVKAQMVKLDEPTFKSLEASCLREGILHPIIVWRGRVCDGMNRLLIAQKHQLAYETKELELPTKKDVMAWMIAFQLGKRNLSAFGRVVVALKMEDYYREKARKNLKLSKGRGNKGKKGRTNVDEVFSSTDTLSQLSEISGVGRTYVANVRYILKYGSEKMIHNCHRGSINIRTAYGAVRDQRKWELKKTPQYKQLDFTNPKKGKWLDQIHCGDALKVLKSLEKKANESVSMVCFSPPYNNDTNYFEEHNDQLPYEDYINWLGKIVLACSKVMKRGGRLCINIDSVTNADRHKENECFKYPIYADLVQKVKELDCGLKFFTDIYWYKDHPIGRRGAFGSFRSPSCPYIQRDGEYILIWSKDTFRLENDTEYEPDITSEEFIDYVRGTWKIKPGSRAKEGHPCGFPLELPSRLIKLLTFPGQTVLDPMVGSGTTCVAAASLNRHWVGIDANSTFCNHAQKRIRTLLKK